MTCPHCGAEAWRPAIAPARKRVLAVVCEAGVVLSAIAAMAWSPWITIAVAFFGLATMVVVLRGRQELCAKCGWARALPAASRGPDPGSGSV